jgi:hypothetical protein
MRCGSWAAAQLFKPVVVASRWPTTTPDAVLLTVGAFLLADPTTDAPKTSKCDRLIAAAQVAWPAIAIMIVAHPCDKTSLRGVASLYAAARRLTSVEV